MVTVVLTNRNRELSIIKKCLNSLAVQSVKDFNVFFVDYGSGDASLNKLVLLVNKYHFIKLISCPVQGQLWNKSRAINIALRQTETPYFFVGDVDLIYNMDFIKRLEDLASENQVHYFRYGYLSEVESRLNKKFEDYKLSHLGTEEGTGSTFFPTKQLKAINGYDEFYHGWGAEDTDVHIRLRNSGLMVKFYDKEVLVKHQWHPKIYRSNESDYPFHSSLEQINYSYMLLTKQLNFSKVNLLGDWGSLPDKEAYLKLSESPDKVLNLTTEKRQIKALLAQLNNFKYKTVLITINEEDFRDKIKQKLKCFLGKKFKDYYTIQMVNDILLELIVFYFRNNPYTYRFDRMKKKITLKLVV